MSPVDTIFSLGLTKLNFEGLAATGGDHGDLLNFIFWTTAGLLGWTILFIGFFALVFLSVAFICWLACAISDEVRR